MSSKIKVASIPSQLPGWYDPSQPGYSPPDNWEGTHVRISVPVSADPTSELEAAYAQLSKKYRGATLHLVPTVPADAVLANAIDTSGSDKQLLSRYFSQIALPEGINKEQLVAYLVGYLPAISAFGIQGMSFKRVTAENVLCFEHVEWDLEQQGLTLITGTNEDWNGRSNGSGKSSFTALPFLALFGKTFKNQTYDGWATQANDNPAVITLDAVLADGRAITITRQRRPGLLRVWVDGTEVTMGKPEATQTLIESLTNLTWEILTNAVYIGQHETGSVFGSDKARKELFSRLLGLDRFLVAQDKLRKAALRIQRSVDDIDSDIQATLAALNEAVHSGALIRAELDSAPFVTRAEINKVTEDIKTLEAQLESKQQEYTTLRTAEEEISKKIHNYDHLISVARTRALIAQEQLEATTRAKGRCTICGSIVEPKTLGAYQKELRNAVLAEEGKLAQYEILVRKHNQRFTAHVLLENTRQRKMNALGTNIRAQQNELNRLTQIQDTRTRLTSIVNDSQVRIEQLKRNLDIHKRARTAVLEEKQFLDICVKSTGRDGLPSYLCASVAPQLNAAAARYSQIFADGQIGIKFTMTDGDIDVDVSNPHGGRYFKDQSAGETGLAGIITAFAFREILVPLNLLICDEPSEGLDTANATAFAQGLSTVVDRFKHVVVISHNTALLGTLEPDFHIEIVKTSGVSVAAYV